MIANMRLQLQMSKSHGHHATLTNDNLILARMNAMKDFHSLLPRGPTRTDHSIPVSNLPIATYVPPRAVDGETKGLSMPFLLIILTIITSNSQKILLCILIIRPRRTKKTATMAWGVYGCVGVLKGMNCVLWTEKRCSEDILKEGVTKLGGITDMYQNPIVERVKMRENDRRFVYRI